MITKKSSNEDYFAILESTEQTKLLKPASGERRKNE